MDQRRLLLAFALSLVVLVLYQELVLRKYRPAQRRAPVSQETQAPSAPPPAAATELGAPPGEEAELVTVETDVLRATISALGARLLKLELSSIGGPYSPIARRSTWCSQGQSSLSHSSWHPG